MALFDAAEEEKLDHLLTEHYHYLVRHISTREFIPHLISKEVLDVQDKEDIESKITSVDRAGRLIDLVKMRGYKGMCEFMLVLEYDAPAAFFHVKQLEARPPPDDWLKIRRNLPSVRKRQSRESMSHLTSLISHLMSELNNQKQAVDQIMRKMKDVKELQSETSHEQEKDFRYYESQITEMEDRYAMLSKELVQSKKEHEETKIKYEELKQENEKLHSQHNEDRQRLSSLQADYDQVWKEIDSLKSRKSQVATRARDSKDVEELVSEIDRLTHLLQSSAQKDSEEEVARLRLQVEKMAQRNAEFSADITKAEEQRDKAAKDLKKLEVAYELQKKRLQSLQEECATAKKRSEDLQRTIGNLEDEVYWLHRQNDRIVNRSTPSTPTSPLLTPAAGQEAARLTLNFKDYGGQKTSPRGSQKGSRKK